MGIITKSEREIEIMRQAGKIVATVLDTLKMQLAAGMKTKELDIIAEREIKKLGARSSFKGYRGFPANLCVSINDEIVHGIPGNKILHEGDIVSLDFGVIYEGYQGDAALTVGVGKINAEAERLITTTEGALQKGILAARSGARLGDVSYAIQQHAESNGFSVVREYTGHGIGRDMHEDPLIPNYGLPGTGPILQTGMTLALEPMLNTGDWHTKVDDDNWTVRTADGGLSAHFEHTIAVNNSGAEVLTAV